MENIPQYVKRKKGEEQPDYMHPMLESVLLETFGVVIYQEQVMEIARTLAGYSDAEADSLRRAMGKKIKKEMDEHRNQFVARAEDKGVDRAQARHIFEQVAKFAGYGFNKSHAAGYAMLTYQTAWLKTHYPREFLSALMILDLNNTDKIALFKQEATRLGIKMVPPDINEAQALFAVRDGEILHALAAIRDVGLEATKNFVAARDEAKAETGEEIKDIFAFAKLCATSGLNKKAIESMAACGVFDSIHPNRRQIFEHASLLAALGRNSEGEQDNLFGDSDDTQTSLPQCEDWGSEERLEREFKAAGMYLSDHPLTPWQDKFESFNILSYDDFSQGTKSLGTLAGVLTGSRTLRSRRGSAYAFATFSDLSGAYEVVIFDEVLRSCRSYFETGNLLVLEVEADRTADQMRLQAKSIKRLNESFKGVRVQQQSLLRLFVPQIDKLPDIKQALAEYPGATRVHLVLDNKTEIALLDGVVVNQKMVEQLKAIGVSVEAA